MIHMIAILLSFLPLLLMILLMWGVINFLCLWIMIRIFHVILILLIYDSTKKYYEIRRHVFIYLNDIKLPLSIMKFLKLHMFCLPMLIDLCFNILFHCNIPMHRKHVRIKCVWYFLVHAPFCASTLILTRASLKM